MRTPILPALARISPAVLGRAEFGGSDYKMAGSLEQLHLRWNLEYFRLIVNQAQAAVTVVDHGSGDDLAGHDRVLRVAAAAAGIEGAVRNVDSARKVTAPVAPDFERALIAGCGVNDKALVIAGQSRIEGYSGGLFGAAVVFVGCGYGHITLPREIDATAAAARA